MTGPIRSVHDSRDDVLAQGGGGIACLAVPGDGRRLAVGSWAETVHIWDVVKRRLAFTFEAHHRSVYCVAFSPDGALVASGDGEDDEKPGRLLVWEAATGRIVQDIGRFPWSIASVAWSPDGERVASACFDRMLRVHEARTGREVVCVFAGQEELGAIAFAPDGALLATGGMSSGVKIWDAATGAEVRILEGHEGEVTALAFAADGRLASVGRDGTARIWNVREGRELLVIRAPSLGGLAFDGRLVVCGSEKRVLVWDAATGRQIAALERHTQQVNAVALGPDGLLASGAGRWFGDGELRLWPLRHGGLWGTALP